MQCMFEMTYCFFPYKIVVFSQKQHTMTLMTFPHRNTWTIPESVFCLFFFILIITAWAKWCPKSYFMFCKTLDYNSWNAFVRAVFCLSIFYVLEKAVIALVAFSSAISLSSGVMFSSLPLKFGLKSYLIVLLSKLTEHLHYTMMVRMPNIGCKLAEK